MNPVITVEDLGKCYTLQHQARSGLLRDQLAGFLRNPFRRAKAAHASAEEFWALRDVNFTVNQGDILGIIGRNGAGKSTLLKILSRITEPTTGRVTLRGRVASLLEVGTGFHGELSGRENIFLNGAILGMTRAEIRRKFDEIIAFAEVEKFLDTPVKHYSSGMYVRLAFAVAAHLEPEILIVDEVLAVGDASFQKKCLGKMREVSAGHGRTVLFVSHNLNAVRELCHTGLLLSAGCVLQQGPIRDVADQYLAVGQRSIYKGEAKSGHEQTPAWFARICVLDAKGIPTGNLPTGTTGSVELEAVLREELRHVQVAVRISTLDGVAIFTTANTDAARAVVTLQPGHHRLRFALPVWLASGFYSITAAIHEPRRQAYAVVVDALQFEITPGASPANALQDDRRGFIEPIIPWEHSHTP
jgi:lipopolysaccharide transport system ATP-binding protein